ncbi:hypothetical protein NC651_022175 [Populus alba x Populus x berolinensis]|nr:hypothetical protein NC651_021538 [Populus alba x Populus x berolinensis]KAJ6895860.1 hypothetical protein NC651_022175 [Populus alba x Populus x berolinensis]
MLVRCHGLVVTSDRGRKEVNVPLLHLLARHAHSIFTKDYYDDIEQQAPLLPGGTDKWIARRTIRSLDFGDR